MKGNKKLLILFTIIFTTIYMIWRIFFTLPFEYQVLDIIFAFVLLGAEFIGMLEQLVHFYNMGDMLRPIKPEVLEGDYPSVDVFVATYNEPIELLYKTINGCVNMRYPDKSKVKIYLCDDGHRIENKDLANKFQIEYLSREDNEGAKAGNLNYALANSQGKLIVTFDADMIPMSDFFMSCVPYFVPDLLNAKELEKNKGVEAKLEREGKIGFVQTPQSFYNLDLFQYNLFSESCIPNEQDYFYRDIELSKNKSNSVIYGGSNTVLSREALEQVGGFVTNVITEDFATGMMIQSKGYQCFAIDEVHASGLSPEDLKNLIKQRRRWARGCIQTGRKMHILFRKGLKFRQKLSYLSSILYWYDSIGRFVYMISPILFAIFGLTLFKANVLQLCMFWLPMYLLNNYTLRKLSGNIRNVRWTNIYETIMFPLLIKDVILEMFGISESVFKVTTKGNHEVDKKYQLKMAIPHLILASVTLFGIVNCFITIFTTGDISSLFVVFWLVTNMYHLIMAIFFMLGRKVVRQSERFCISLDCQLNFQGKHLLGRTVDISESGFAVELEFPEFVPYDEIIQAKLSDGRYEALVNARIVQVVEMKSTYRYAFQIVSMTEKDYRNLMHLFHDRIPPLTKKLKKNYGFYDDLRTNILKRVKKNKSLCRKLPRIFMNTKLYTTDGIEITLLSFNYCYVTMVIKHPIQTMNNMTITLSENVDILLEYVKELNYEKGQPMHLYRVLNMNEIKDDNNVKSFLIRESAKYKNEVKGNKNYETYKKQKEFSELDLL